MSRYRKFIAAVVGLALLLLNRRYGVDLFGAEEYLVEITISVGTPFFVWLVPNETPEQAKCQCSDS